MLQNSQLRHFDNFSLTQSESLLDRCYDYCQHIIDKNSKSFSYSSSFLPQETRKSVVALYAFCRLVDDMVDETDLDNNTIYDELEDLKDEVHQIQSKNLGQNPILIAFSDTLRKHSIPIEYVEELIKGVQMDLKKHRYQTFDELYLYSYRVASTVGLMMTHIFMENPSNEVLSKAVSMGIAMQLTNILRDIAEDFQMGRIYLPLDLMKHFNVKEEDLERSSPTKNFIELISHLISIAKKYYEVGFQGVNLLPDGANFVVALSGEIYGEILEEIRRANYHILDNRVYVSKIRKMWIAFKLRLKFRKSLNRN